MDLIFVILAAFSVLLVSFIYRHRNGCIKKVLNMSCADKSRLLSGILEPFGLSYLNEQDIFTTRLDAWQRGFGHTNRYDQNALSMNMVFDCEPVYFNYHGKTWLIEFWKGQYGIHTGAEAGVFHADSVVPPVLRQQTIFEAVSPEEMLSMKLCLTVPGCPLFRISRTHWWLAGFITGICSQPEEMTLEITITFPDDEMCTAFVRALVALGYKRSELTLGQTTVRFCFEKPQNTIGIPWDTWVESYVLWKARVACRLFIWFTRPFSSVQDRILFLWYYCPVVFRKIVRFRRY